MEKYLTIINLTLVILLLQKISDTYKFLTFENTAKAKGVTFRQHPRQHTLDYGKLI